MKYFLLVTTALWSAFGHSTGPRWRYVALPENLNSQYKRQAKDINESGQIAIHEYGPNQFSRSGVYQPAVGSIDWAPPVGEVPYFDATSMLNNGEIAGQLTVLQPVTWSLAGGFTYLPSSAPAWIRAIQVNNNRGFIGYAPQFAGRRDLYYYDQSGYYFLRDGFDLGNAFSINDAGYIAGNLAGSATNDGRQETPVLWDPLGQSYRVLTSPNQRYGSAKYVTNSGIVYGVVSKDGPNPGWYGVWWDLQGNVLRERYLNALGFYGVNQYDGPYGEFKATDSGNLYYIDTVDGVNLRARFYSPLTGEIDITSNIEGLPSGWAIDRVTGFSESGFLAGVAYKYSSNGQIQRTYNFYLEPVPEPATLAALGVGVVTLLRRRKARQA